MPFSFHPNTKIQGYPNAPIIYWGGVPIQSRYSSYKYLK